jgi:hypothetical protein
MFDSAGLQFEGGAQPIMQRSLSDDDAAAGIGDQMGQLLGRGGVVHRERCRAQQQRTSVGDVKLGAVVQQQPEGLLVAQAQRGQPGRGAAGQRAVVAPGQHHIESGVEDGRRVTTVLHRSQKRLAHRGRAASSHAAHCIAPTLAAQCVTPKWVATAARHTRTIPATQAKLATTSLAFIAP